MYYCRQDLISRLRVIIRTERVVRGVIISGEGMAIISMIYLIICR